jgi:hypothetical protein
LKAYELGQQQQAMDHTCSGIINVLMDLPANTSYTNVPENKAHLIIIFNGIGIK